MYSQVQEHSIEQRVLDVLQYTIQTNATVRQTAKIFGISKSTVHKDIKERAPILRDKGVKGITKKLVRDAQNVLANNKAERHIRGGQATRMKYQQSQRERPTTLQPQSPVFIPSTTYKRN